MTAALSRFLAGPALALWAGGILAAGLGNIQVSSSLNQPLSASIPILGMTTEDMVNMTVNLAEPKTFQQAGIPRPFLLTTLEFQVVDNGDGSGYIAVSTKERIKEPALEFIIDVNWSKGRIRRTYSALMERKSP